MISGADVKGVVAMLVTPFTKSGDVDLEAVEAISSHLLAAGVHGLVPVGPAGESAALLREERRDVVAAAARVAKGKVPLIAGVSAASTREVVLLANEAAAAGADAVLVAPPSCMPLPADALARHLADAAEDIDCPLVVANSPRYTGVSLGPGLLARLMGTRNVIGAANAAADTGELVDSIRLAPRGRSLCAGLDSQFYAALCVGASGLFSTAAGVIPSQVVKLHTLFAQGKRGEALALSLALQELACLLGGPCEAALAKEALVALGLPGGYPRAPLPRADAEQKRVVRAALRAIGALDGAERRWSAGREHRVTRRNG
jgi:4-hydroxy-tetrahydrodipicolinate synthase